MGLLRPDSNFFDYSWFLFQGLVDPAEVHFLILHYLSLGPCQNAVRGLAAEAEAHGLLPSRLDVFGNLFLPSVYKCQDALGVPLTFKLFEDNWATLKEKATAFEPCKHVGSGIL